MMLLDFRGGPNLYVIPKGALRELEGPRRILPPFECEHLERARTPISPKAKPLAFPHDWLKISQIPHYNCRWKDEQEIKSSPRKVSNPSTIPALRS